MACPDPEASAWEADEGAIDKLTHCSILVRKEAILDEMASFFLSNYAKYQRRARLVVVIRALM